MPKKLFFLIVVLISVSITQAQIVPDAKKVEETDKLQNDAIVFLRETLGEVNNMRSLENRISFGAEMASLMWFHDEKEARGMYQAVVSDFRRLLFDFDNQLNNFAISEASPEDDYPTGGLFADFGTRANVERKFRKALELRQQIALSLAEHEPDLALSFYYDSIAGLTNPMIVERSREGEAYFEVQLMTQIAESNAAKAAEFATKSIEKGFNYQHLELLKKIYAKDPDKGIDFASAIVSHVKRTKFENSEMWTVGSLIRFGEETAKSTKTETRKTVMSNQQLRDLTEVIAQAILAGEDDELGGGFTDLIEKYTPARAAQIRAKNRRNRGSNYNMVANAMNSAASAMAYAANAANSVGPSPDAERRAKALEERMDAEKKVMEDVQTIGNRSLPKADRDKIVVQARKIISQSPGKDKKLMGLSLLAGQVAKAGDVELAIEMMKEAEAFVNPQPKNYQDFMLTWLLVAGYAEVDTDKAFPMLTDTIFRLNDTISAFVKAAEFIDVQGEIISDGEVQVGQFGGSMLRNITKELKIAEPTLSSLAKADFARTKAATNTFDRPEVRILAKMMVLRTILGNKEKPDKEPDVGLVLN